MWEVSEQLGRTEPSSRGGVSMTWRSLAGVASRLLLGGILLYSGALKLGHSAELARVINGYRLLHVELVDIPAIALPWLEIVLGALLVLGLLRRSTALLACGLFATFVVAIALAMARGIDTPCGCFSVAAGSEHVGWGVLSRDALLAMLSAYLVVDPSVAWELDTCLFGSAGD
jgi:uncharacterized membrane protein YphA (DoxX/SURF4 family)